MSACFDVHRIQGDAVMVQGWAFLMVTYGEGSLVIPHN